MYDDKLKEEYDHHMVSGTDMNHDIDNHYDLKFETHKIKITHNMVCANHNYVDHSEVI